MVNKKDDNSRQRKFRVLLIHNIIAPYRLPIFEKLSEEFNLDVLFTQRKTEDRKWKVSLEGYSFKSRVLKSLKIGPFLINYMLPFRLLSDNHDIYLVGENPETVFASFITSIYATLSRKSFILWSEVIKTDYSQRRCDSNAFKQMFKLFYNKFLILYRRFLYQQTDAFIAYSRKAKEYLLENGVSKDKIFVGEQVMPKVFLSRASLRKSDTKFKKKRIILYLGYLNRRKGVNYLIQAYKKLSINDSCLVIAGTGPDEGRLKSLAKDEPNINFVGYVEHEEKANYYSIADVFVLPTLHDPWGLVINEAMYYGLPIITTDAAGASEMVRKNKNGFIVKSGDSKELADSLRKLLHNDKLRKEMGQRSRQYKNAFDVNHGIKPFREAINNLYQKRDVNLE